jgi:hypothetical protein
MSQAGAGGGEVGRRACLSSNRAGLTATVD